MTPTFLGKIAPTAAGTPAAVTTNRAIRCARIEFAAIPGSAGKVYVGSSQLNRTTLAGVGRVFPVPAASGALEAWRVEPKSGMSNGHTLADYWIDADTNGEGVLVTYWTI